MMSTSPNTHPILSPKFVSSAYTQIQRWKQAMNNNMNLTCQDYGTECNCCLSQHFKQINESKFPHNVIKLVQQMFAKITKLTLATEETSTHQRKQELVS